MKRDLHKPLTNVVLYTEGCPATPKTVALVEEYVSGMGLRAELKKIPIHAQDEADARNFPGSPTVQINGVDIDPSVRGDTRFGFM